MQKIFIDPRTNIVYASYYIEGLYKTYGRRNVKFSMSFFKDLNQKSKLEDFDQYFSFVLIDKEKILKKVVIDFRDKNNINIDALNWSNIYGKVNFNSAVIDLIKLDTINKNKVIAIGPNFGIRIWTPTQTTVNLFKNYIKSYSRLPVSFRVFLSGYRWQMIRAKIDDYTKETATQNSVFFISSLYKNEEHGPSTNLFRASFIRACIATKINFKGGLFSKTTNPNYATYKDVVTDVYYKADEYLNNTKESICVFNTPAAHGCHGWKLGEFMAMGKAIISMPFLNQMPFDLEHGKNIHFVSNVTDLELATRKIIDDSNYRRSLEYNLNEYYKQFLTPVKVIERLLL